MNINVYEGQPRVSRTKPLLAAKLPTIINIDHTPFDDEVFVALKEQDEEYKQELPVNSINTIRWRFVPGELDEEGNPKKETNTRFVRWSDGSLSLMIGDKEMFDVEVKPFPTPNKNYLYSVMNEGSGMTCQKKLSDRITFQPASPSAQKHLKIALAVSAAKKRERKQLKLVASNKDPLKEKLEQEKEEERRIREERRREEQIQRVRPGTTASSLRDFLEGDEYDYDDEGDYDMEGELSSKRQREEEIRERRIREAKELPPLVKKKKPKVAPKKRDLADFIVDDEEEGGEGEEEEDDYVPAGAFATRVRKGVIVSDDEEEE